MIQQAVRPLRRRDGLSAIESLSRHWPEYLMEVAELGLYMVAICIFATLLQHPDSPVRHLIENALLLRGLMGAAMGMTIVTIILSPWGKQSGGHFNPAITITFYRLGKVEFWDLWFYVTSQFAGAALGVCVARYVLLGALNDRAVHYALTTPGIYGEGVAFAAEFTISLLLMLVILFAANRATLASYAPVFAGSLIAVYVAFETPLSGMSTNPARTFGSALHADSWSTLWIYFLAPTLGMLVAGEIFLRVRGGLAPYCAKLHHANDKRCIFRHA